MLRLILCALCLTPLTAGATDLPAYTGDLSEFDNIRSLPAKGDGPARLVLGDTLLRLASATCRAILPIGRGSGARDPTHDASLTRASCPAGATAAA